MVEIKYPTVKTMYYRTPQGGSMAEGRSHLKGIGAMECSSYCKLHHVHDIRHRITQVPELPNIPVLEFTYQVDIDTFPILDLISQGDGFKRLDTLSFWECTFQEILRHLALASDYTKSAYWQDIIDVKTSLRAELIDVIDKYIKGILSEGDTSKEHFTFYVKEHANSASPFGPKWGTFIDDEGQLTRDGLTAWERTNRWIEEFHRDWQSVMSTEALYLNPKYCYPAMRARPGDYTILERSDRHISALVRKWRDRKAGGIKGLGQLSYPIYKLPAKKKVEAHVYDWIAKILGCEVCSLNRDGIEAYQYVLDNNLNCYDVKTAEKQVGLCFSDFPFVVDLGHPKFEAAVSSEMYSGISFTTLLNELFITVMLRAICDSLGIKISKLAIFSDNFAVDIELPPTPHYDKEPAFCGFLPASKRFGPPSLCTDNPKHRLNIKGGYMRQIQTQQYDMRPLLSVIMNNVRSYDSATNFLQWVIDKKVTAEFEILSKDNIIEAFFEQKNLELHESFRDAFSAELAYVQSVFLVQSVNPDNPSNLRVYP